MLHCIQHQPGNVFRTGFNQQVVAVPIHGFRANEKLFAYFFSGELLADEFEDFFFPAGELF